MQAATQVPIQVPVQVPVQVIDICAALYQKTATMSITTPFTLGKTKTGI